MNRAPKIFYSIILFGAAILLTLVFLWLTVWNLFWVWLTSVSLVTFLAYGYDKVQAKTDGSRVPEIVLHLLALAGGFIGGWAGRFIFHHKTRHNSFTVVLIISTVMYVVLAYLLFWK